MWLWKTKVRLKETPTLTCAVLSKVGFCANNKIFFFFAEQKEVVGRPVVRVDEAFVK